MNQLFTDGISAFAGAFFAFLFLRLAEFFTKIYDRQVKHFNSLVTLETQLNELLGVVHDNAYLIQSFKETILNGNIYFSKLRLLPFDRSHYNNLHDISLINDLFSFNYLLRKLNDDIDSLTDGYTDIKNAYIHHDISKSDYLINAQISAKHLNTLELFLNDVEKHTIRLLAKIRLMSPMDIPLGTKIMKLFIHTSGSKLKTIEIDNETRKLLKEINETKKRSQKEIEKLTTKKATK